MRRLGIFFLFTLPAHLECTTLVYNLKIRRAFSVSGLLGKPQDRALWAISLLPIGYGRSRAIDGSNGSIDEHIGMGGSIFNVRYIPSRNWWAEVTTGIEVENAKYRGDFKSSKTHAGLDDIVISAGHNWFIGNRTQCVLFALGGFPTQTKVKPHELSNTLVGTRFFAVGGGAELSYSFLSSPRQSCNGIVQARFIHFFSRSWQPILPCGAKIEPGNITDLLCTVQYRRKRNLFEVGYNPTFFTNAGVAFNGHESAEHPFVRNSLYLNYAHIFKDLPMVKSVVVVGVGGNVSVSRRFDTKAGAGWLNVTTIF